MPRKSSIESIPHWRAASPKQTCKFTFLEQRRAEARHLVLRPRPVQNRGRASNGPDCAERAWGLFSALCGLLHRLALLLGVPAHVLLGPLRLLAVGAVAGIVGIVPASIRGGDACHGQQQRDWQRNTSEEFPGGRIRGRGGHGNLAHGGSF